jgi:hypothetical protein
MLNRTCQTTHSAQPPPPRRPTPVPMQQTFEQTRLAPPRLGGFWQAGDGASLRRALLRQDTQTEMGVVATPLLSRILRPRLGDGVIHEDIMAALRRPAPSSSPFYLHDTKSTISRTQRFLVSSLISFSIFYFSLCQLPRPVMGWSWASCPVLDQHRRTWRPRELLLVLVVLMVLVLLVSSAGKIVCVSDLVGARNHS